MEKLVSDLQTFARNERHLPRNDDKFSIKTTLQTRKGEFYHSTADLMVNAFSACVDTHNISRDLKIRLMLFLLLSILLKSIIIGYNKTKITLQAFRWRILTCLYSEYPAAWGLSRPAFVHFHYFFLLTHLKRIFLFRLSKMKSHD